MLIIANYSRAETHNHRLDFDALETSTEDEEMKKPIGRSSHGHRHSQHHQKHYQKPQSQQTQNLQQQQKSPQNNENKNQTVFTNQVSRPSNFKKSMYE